MGRSAGDFTNDALGAVGGGGWLTNTAPTSKQQIAVVTYANEGGKCRSQRQVGVSATDPRSSSEAATEGGWEGGREGAPRRAAPRGPRKESVQEQRSTSRSNERRSGGAGQNVCCTYVRLSVSQLRASKVEFVVRW